MRWIMTQCDKLHAKRLFEDKWTDNGLHGIVDGYCAAQPANVKRLNWEQAKLLAQLVRKCDFLHLVNGEVLPIQNDGFRLMTPQQPNSALKSFSPQALNPRQREIRRPWHLHRQTGARTVEYVES